jgi:phage shock protein B
VDEIIVPVMLFATLFIGLPWLILHYTTKWRSSATLTTEDENLLDELYDTARRLEDRLHTVERIVAADHPDWRPAVRADDEDERLDYRPERRSISDRSN